MQNLEYIEELPPKTEREQHWLIFKGQLVEDLSYKFNIHLYINPENYYLYLDIIQLYFNNDSTTVSYKRLYKPNEKIKQYIDDILEVNP